MRTHIFYILILLALLSCDNTFEELGASNNPPTVRVIQNGSELQTVDGKLKTSLKHGSDHYTIELVVFDAEGGFASLSGQVVIGDGHFKQGAEEKSIFTVSAGRATVDFYPTGDVDQVQLKFVAVDNLSSAGNAVVNLEVFANRPPVAVFTGIELVGVNSSREYYLNATASFDQDLNEGGGLQKLEWSVNGSTFITNDPFSKTPYIFPQAGNYLIKVRAIDNDGAYSEWVEKPTFTIN